jgi:hypothetical protein
MKSRLASMLLALLGLSLQAQVEFSARVDTPQTLLAQPVVLELTASQLTATPQWPPFPDSTAFELLDADTLYPNPNTAVLRWEMVAYDSGYCIIPPLALIHNEDTLWSDPVLVRVEFPPIDPQTEPADIRGLETVPPLWPLLVLVGLKLLAILTALIMMLRKRRQAQRTATPPPVLTPWQQAQHTLLALKKRGAWEQDPVKDFCTTVSDTLRRYAEHTWEAPVMERTTAETALLLAEAGMAAPSVSQLIQLLQWADMAKFARQEPTPAERLHHLDQALDWLVTNPPNAPAHDPVD